MTRQIQVQYENKVFKPLRPVRGIREHATAWMIFCEPRKPRVLRSIAGTLNDNEAHAMRTLISEEFERIEGEC